MGYANSLTLSTTQNTRQLPQTRVVSGGLMNYTLGYDANANLKTILDGVGQDSRTLDYDDLNRMTVAHAPAVFGNETYTYDPLDNVRGANIAPARSPISMTAAIACSRSVSAAQLSSITTTTCRATPRCASSRTPATACSPTASRPTRPSQTSIHFAPTRSRQARCYSTTAPIA